ncbi:MFS transporter [Burkholderiaceae bacterium UC74_6]
MNLRQASHALRSQFFICGVLFATWGVHVPTVKAHYGLDERELAGAMLAAGIGSLAALSQAGRAVAKLGPRGVSLLTGPACCVAIASLIASQHVAALFALMLVFGALISLLDVAVNAEASEIERQTGAHVMSGFHGMFSLGGMFGAGLGSAATALGFTPQQHLLLAAGIGLPTLIVGSFFMLPVEPQPDDGGKPHSRIPRGALLLIGVLAALGLVTEGAMYDWSVLYMKQERASDTATAALAYAAFSAAMAGGRFCGDWVRARWSPIAVMRCSGTLAAVGMALVLVLPWPMASLLTFALVGLGLANVVPVLFSAASNLPGVPPAHAIAAVSSVGWLGMMAGPPMIGFIAQASSLTVGLIVVVVFAAVMALAAQRALADVHQGSPSQ